MSAQSRPSMTYAEYLELEATNPERHEYLRGEVRAMAGGAPSHAGISGNVYGAIWSALQGKPCAASGSDLQVRVVDSDRSTYPDVAVVCGKRETASDDKNAVVNPTLIVEVLSDGTEASDRGERFAHLSRLPSLQEYVLVSQNTKRVEVFRRGEGADWTYRPCAEDATVELTSIGVTMSVAKLYRDPTA